MKNQSLFILAKTLVITVFISACTSQEKPKNTVKTTPVKVDTVATKAIKTIEAKPALGIDVSHFQGEINWEEIKENNISFAYSKATEGHTYVDPKFHENWKNMTTAEISKGAYHFYTTDSDGNNQALHYINTIKEIKKGDLPPVLDLEQGGLKAEVTVEEYQKEVINWLSTVEKELGVKPIIYTNNPFANKYLNKPHFANYTLWIAEYGVKEAKTPTAWKDTGWAIWQRTESGSIEGEVGNVDHDITKVSLESLLVK